MTDIRTTKPAVGTAEPQDKNIYQRLLDVQREAVAPRQLNGKFGKARSAEQILEAYKPVCVSHGLYLYTDDEIVEVNGRNYVTAAATVINVDNPEERHTASASAWENTVELSKEGRPILDTSQVTGKTSSYAKKYALQNLFAIDDTKDADIDERSTRTPQKSTDRPGAAGYATDNQRREVARLLTLRGYRTPEEQKAKLTEMGVLTPISVTAASYVLGQLQGGGPV